MDYFNYRNNELFAEDVALTEILKKVKTPFYVYSKKTLLRHFNQIKEAFKELNPLICFAVKSNSNIDILKILKEEGAGFDIVSGGELYLLKKIKALPDKIVFAGVGKSEEEIKDAIKYGILLFNCESLPEIELINKIAKRKVNIALRINPDVVPKTHKYITTGKKDTKFGISIYELNNILKEIKKFENINLIGIHFHLGSQILEPFPYIVALKKILNSLKIFEYYNYRIEYLNIGGGFGAIYKNEEPMLPYQLANKIVPLIKNRFKLIMEPGRYIVANAGILVTKVLFVKKSLNKTFVIVDAGMNTLIRPTLYNAYHHIIPVIKKSNEKFKVDVVGPICETGDYFAKDRVIPKVESGDFLVIKTAGAYGRVMASNYNARPLQAEILVDNDKFFISRKAQSYKDLL